MIKKLKLLLIRSNEDSTWGSCRVISPNLQAAYQLLENCFEIYWFDIPIKYIPGESHESSVSLLDLANLINKVKFDRIISLDHYPVQPNIFVNLIKIIPLEKLPPIIFHIYGDFTYFAENWKKFGKNFSKHPVRFIVASEAQKRLIDFFEIKKNDIAPLFFPVNSAEFAYSSELRKLGREEQKVADDTLVVAYAGRISLQKNVDLLIKILNKEAENINKKIELWIIGAIDDQSAYFANIFTHQGYLYSKISEIVNKSKNIQIKFLGHKKKKELQKLMCAADCYMSLSLYHDEDFGMSPAEALACGLPSLLTDWGGYSSFVSKNLDWQCSLMEVDINEFGHVLNRNDMQKFLKNLIELAPQDEQRALYSESFLKSFSIPSALPKLKDYIEKDIEEFHGFNWNLSMLGQCYRKRPSEKKLNLNLLPSIDNMYYEMYKNYISKKWDTSK